MVKRKELELEALELLRQKSWMMWPLTTRREMLNACEDISESLHKGNQVLMMSNTEAKAVEIIIDAGIAILAATDPEISEDELPATEGAES